MRLQVGQNPFVNEYTDSDGVRKQQYDDDPSDDSVGGCNIYIIVIHNHNPTTPAPCSQAGGLDSSLLSFLQKEGELVAVISQVGACNLFQTTRIRTLNRFVVERITFFKTGSAGGFQSE